MGTVTSAHRWVRSSAPATKSVSPPYRSENSTLTMAVGMTDTIYRMPRATGSMGISLSTGIMMSGTASRRIAETSQMRQPRMVRRGKTANRLPATSMVRAMVAAPRLLRPSRKVCAASAKLGGSAGQAIKSRAATNAKLSSSTTKGGLKSDFRRSRLRSARENSMTPSDHSNSS